MIARLLQGDRRFIIVVSHLSLLTPRLDPGFILGRLLGIEQRETGLQRAVLPDSTAVTSTCRHKHRIGSYKQVGVPYLPPTPRRYFDEGCHSTASRALVLIGSSDCTLDTRVLGEVARVPETP